MLNIKHVIFVFLFYYGAPLYGQCDLILRGQVRDDDNSEDLGYAMVKVLDPPIVVQSNEKGEFELRNLCAGNYQVMITHVGCRDTVFAISLTRSKKVVFKLPHSLNALNDIEIVTTHEEVKPVHAAHVLEGKNLDRVKGLSIADQLRQLNGVAAINTGPTIAKPMINGMQGYRVLLLNNGVRQEGQQWGSEHAPEIDPFIAQRLTVIRGASSVRYGSDAIGGVILAEPEHLPDTASMTGEMNLAGFTNGRGAVASLMLQGAFDKLKYFSWRAQGSWKQHGNIQTPGYFLHNTGVKDHNFSYSLAYHRKRGGATFYYSQVNSRVGIFSGSHVESVKDLEAAFARNKPLDSLAGFSYQVQAPYQQIGHELVKVSSDFHTGNRSRVFVNYAFQFNRRQEFDAHGAEEAEAAPASDYRLATHTPEIYWEHDHIRSFRGRVGVQATYQENVYREHFFIPNYIAKGAGFFMMERFVRSGFEVEAGLRFDHKELQAFYYKGSQLQEPVRTFRNMSYHAGMVLKPLNALRISFHAGTGWRPPAINELYSNGLHHGVGAIERGNDKLERESSQQVATSVLFKYKKLTAELNAFNYWFRNFIYYVPSPSPELTLRGAFPVFNYTQNKVLLNGMDMMMVYHAFRQLAVKGRAVYVRGYNKDLGQPLLYMPSDRYEILLSLQMNDLGIARENFVEPVLTHVTRQTRVPAGLDFLPPPGAYWLVGLSAGTTLSVKSLPVSVSITVTNLANTVYREYLDRFRYFNDAAGTNVWLRLKVPFTLYDKK